MPASKSIRHRLAWFVVCLAVGTATGMTGDWFSGNPYWYLAIPAALAVGWLWIANPDECCPPAARRASKAPGDDGPT